jgi:hypothetical protein
MMHPSDRDRDYLNINVNNPNLVANPIIATTFATVKQQQHLQLLLLLILILQLILIITITIVVVTLGTV